MNTHFCKLVSRVLVAACSFFACSSESLSADGLARLRLDNGQFVDGSVAPAPDGEFGWQSPHFLLPLRFDLALISSIDFKQPALADDKSGEFVFVLGNGVRLVGDLVRIDDGSIELESKLLGRILLPRAQLRQIERRDRSAQLVYDGPRSLEEWTSNPPNAWLFEAGSLQSNSNGISLRGNVEIPDSCRLELRLAWDAKPSFVVAVGPEQKGGTENFAAARLEVWDNQLTLVRESGRNADIAILSQLADREDHIELTLFLNQKTGDVAVYSELGELLERLTVPFEKPTVRKDVMIVNNGSRLRLEKLNVYHWDGTLPDDHLQTGAYVSTTDRKTVKGSVTAFDAEKKQLNLQPESSLPLQQVAKIVFSSDNPTAPQPESNERAAPNEPAEKVEPPEATPREVGIEIRLRDNSRLLGKWIGVDSQNIVRFQTAGIDRVLQFPSSQLNSIMRPRHGHTVASVNSHENPTEVGLDRPGLLVGQQVNLPGSLVPQPEDSMSAALWWHSRVAKAAVPINLSISGTIDYTRPLAPTTSPVVRTNNNLIPMRIVGPFRSRPNMADRVPQTKPLKPGLVFRSGDRIDGEVEKIDERGVYFKSSMTQKGFSTHDQMQSIVLANSFRSPQLSEEKLSRLLTVPRSNRNDPPTHLLIATNGDYLRGRLIRVEEENATMEVRLSEVQVPRKAITQIIWLHDRNWTEQPQTENNSNKPGTADSVADVNSTNPASNAPDKGFQSPAPSPTGFVHAIDSKGGSLTFVPTQLQDGNLKGASELLGNCNVAIRDLNSILLGPDVAIRALDLQKESWKLSLARNPRVFDEQAAGDSGAVPTSQRSPLVSKPAPDFSLGDLQNNVFTLSEHKGRVIVLDFWASWCGPCMQTMPQVDRIVSEVGNGQVELVAVNLQETAERARSAMQRLKIAPRVVLDVDGEVAQFYDAQAIPQTVIIDRTGVVRHLFVGGGGKFTANFTEALKATLADTVP